MKTIFKLKIISLLIEIFNLNYWKQFTKKEIRQNIKIKVKLFF